MIILSNLENIFCIDKHANLLSRVHKIILGRKDFCRWSNISGEDFNTILRFILKDLIISLEDKAFSNNVNYGSPAKRVSFLRPI